MLTFIFRHPVIITFGLALVVLSFYLTWRKHNLLLSGHLADGEVIELIPHRGSKGGTTYNTRVAFTQADGSKSEFVSTFGSSTPLHALGEKIRVVYYAGATKPDILAFPDSFLFPWACFCAGFFVLLMSAGFIFGPGLIDSIYLPRMADPNAPRIFNVLK